ETERAAPVVVDRLAGLALERLVDRDAPTEQAHDVVALVELRAEACRVPRRAARQLVLLEQQRVRPAEPGQVVEERATADAAADHYELGFREHRWNHPNVRHPPTRRTNERRDPRGAGEDLLGRLDRLPAARLPAARRVRRA